MKNRGDDPPPFAVRRARPEAAAPLQDGLRIGHRTVGPEGHHEKDGHVDGDERRRCDRPGRPLAQGVLERGVGRWKLRMFLRAVAHHPLCVGDEPLGAGEQALGHVVQVQVLRGLHRRS